MRIPRSDYFMEIAKLVAKRSPCLSRQVGAVVVGDNRILGTGYNGPPAGYPHCEVCKRQEIGKQLDNCPALHAETNAIFESQHSRRKPDMIFVTVEPCFNCCKQIAIYGIKKIIFFKDYNVSKLCNEFLMQNEIRKIKYGSNKFGF
jgi:dCMP deaminase